MKRFAIISFVLFFAIFAISPISGNEGADKSISGIGSFEAVSLYTSVKQLQDAGEAIKKLGNNQSLYSDGQFAALVMFNVGRIKTITKQIKIYEEVSDDKELYQDYRQVINPYSEAVEDFQNGFLKEDKMHYFRSGYQNLQQGLDNVNRLIDELEKKNSI